MGVRHRRVALLIAEHTAFSSTCDASSNFHLFAKSSFKNFIAFGICDRASIKGSFFQFDKWNLEFYFGSSKLCGTGLSSYRIVVVLGFLEAREWFRI
ncbi:hypothetical protein GOBAR_AA28302 [Gossypium barbadense]|uniref:Uncharacterized protein n=1 Tax=Gossypium barbadense TaxID=3634 RepID=A0A2P5WMQ8_GOSBA|nr:hypothetical protein GOBAR_AA28302 [Gossypium barbadense]